MSTLVEIPKIPNALSLNAGVFRASVSKSDQPGPWPQLTYVRPEVTLTDKMVKRYARACRMPADQGVPLLLPHIAAFPLAMMMFKAEEFPYKAMGMVHLANHVRLNEVLNVGDKLRIEVSTDKLYAHEKGQVVIMRAEASRQGKLVWSSDWYFLRPGISNPQGEAYESSLSENTLLYRQADINANISQTRRYGIVSGDVNPIHMQTLAAKALGFRRALAHGMWTKARALSYALPVGETQPCDVHVEFKSPLYLPSRAALWVKHTEQNSCFEVRNNKGDKLHLRGEYKALSGSE